LGLRQHKKKKTEEPASGLNDVGPMTKKMVSRQKEMNGFTPTRKKGKK